MRDNTSFIQGQNENILIRYRHKTIVHKMQQINRVNIFHRRVYPDLNFTTRHITI